MRESPAIDMRFRYLAFFLPSVLLSVREVPPDPKIIKRPFHQFLFPFKSRAWREKQCFLIKKLSVREVPPDPQNN